MSSFSSSTNVLVQLNRDRDPESETIKLFATASDSSVRAIQAVLDDLGLAVRDAPTTVDEDNLGAGQQQMWLHSTCNVSCQHTWTLPGDAALIEAEGKNKVRRSKCSHQFHPFCLRVMFALNLDKCFGHGRDQRFWLTMPLELYKTLKLAGGKCAIPDDYCPLCSSPNALANMQRMRKFNLVASRQLIQFLTLQPNLHRSVVPRRPVFLLKHKDVLSAACQCGDLIDVGGHRWEHVLGLDATRTWRRLKELSTQPRVATIPHTFWKARGREYYQEFANMCGMDKVIFALTDQEAFQD